MELKLHPKQGEAFQSNANEILYGGSAGGGKAVALQTLIATHSGFKLMSDMRVGDMVIGRNGLPTRVIALSDIETPDVAYELEFDTGDTVICDERHLWVTWTDKERLQILRAQPEWREARRARRASRAVENPKKPWARENILKRNAMAREDLMDAPEPVTRTTKEIVETLKVRGTRTNHSIPICGAVEYPEAELLVDPYLLGLWIGDGDAHRFGLTGLKSDCDIWLPLFEDYEKSIVLEMPPKRKQPTYRINFTDNFSKRLDALNLRHNKHIPEVYLRSSIEQRMALLRGIMDTDGWCEKDGQCAIGFSDRRLIEDTRELVTSLGFKAGRICTKKTIGKDAHRFAFMANRVVFGLPRKVERQKIAGHRQVNSMRYIIAARRVESVPMRCIQVEDESGTYLVGRGHIVTHNSHLVRVAAMAWAYDCPGIQIYLFRRNFPDMEKNHLHGESGFLSLMGEWFERKFVSYDGAKHIFKFANGSVIYLCHLNSRRDLQNYQGAEIHVLLLDEGTQFEEDEYRYLRARVRLGGWRPPERWSYAFPRVMITANPGGVGHMWVKAAFIDARPPMEISRMPKEEGGMLRQYIPARLTDNPTMDADYASKLAGMGSPELVKAWLDGDWNVVAGTALEMLDKKKHAVRRFTVPEHWTRIMSMDWGTAKPFAVVWCAVVEGGTVIRGKKDGERDVYLPDGALVAYREFYGWNGKADTGCRKTSPEVARDILKLENGEHIDYRVGDSAMWAQTDGPSPQENMYTATGGKFILRQAQKDREMNYIEVRQRLIGEEGHPMLFFMEDLHHTWRTLPGLQLDETNPEKGPDSKQEDHCFVGDTEIMTINGICPIKDIQSGDLVLTTIGYKPCIQLGVTAQSDDIYEIEFDDGAVFQATGSHPFLVDDWIFYRLDSIHCGMKVVCISQSSSSTNVAKNSWASIITCAASTFRKRAAAYIGLFTSIIKEVFQKVPTSTILTETEAITTFQTCKCLLQSSTSISTAPKSNAKSICKNTSKRCNLKLLHGIRAQKDGRGILKMQKNLEPNRQVSSVSVQYAERNFYPNTGIENCAEEPAVPVVGEKTILRITRIKKKQNVWNLHVPEINNFCLSNGVVVHNCWDSIAYLCRSRPFRMSVEDRREQQFKRLMKEAKKAGVKVRW